MPVNKNAYLRYQILDQCFSHKFRRFNFDDLVDYVSDKLGYNISPRQIRNDIATLREGPYYAPIRAIPYDGKKCYYHYGPENPDFSIFKNELTTEEVTHLRSTIEMLSRYRGIPANAWLEEVISNLEYRFGVKANTENLISFEQNDMLKGLENLSGLIDATINHQALDLTYKSYGKDQRQMVVHPYYIKQYNGRWFLFGKNASHNRIETYALDRIEQYALSDKPFEENTTIDFASHFDDVIGVSVPYSKEVTAEEIVLRFSPKRFPYVVSKPIHHSQKTCEEPYTVSIRVKPNRELSQQIFSFMPDVEVLSPEWFRKEICDKIQQNLNKYASVKKGHTDNA